MPEPELKNVQKYARASASPCDSYAEAVEVKEEVAKKHRREKVKVKIRFRRRKNSFEVVLYRRLGKPEAEEPAAA
jgi:hypothetical protein